MPKKITRKPTVTTWKWDMVSQLILSIVPPGKSSTKLVITFNPALSPYMVAAETSANSEAGALASHKHQLIGPTGGIKDAMLRAEVFANEWLKGKGFDPEDCTCDDIHPGTKLRPVRKPRKKS